MVTLLNAIIKIASDHPETRKHLLPLIKNATKVWKSEEARAKYLDEHPNANPRNHVVEETKDKKKGCVFPLNL